jgi:hypothetical protein
MRKVTLHAPRKNQPVRMIWAMARASLRSVLFGMASIAAFAEGVGIAGTGEALKLIR